MLRHVAGVCITATILLAGCGGSGYAVRPVPRIAADNVGKPVSLLQEAFGEPRKIETTSTKLIYVWFLPQKPKDGSPSGFQGCEMEVTVDARSQLFSAIRCRTSVGPRTATCSGAFTWRNAEGFVRRQHRAFLATIDRDAR